MKITRVINCCWVLLTTWTTQQKQNDDGAISLNLHPKALNEIVNNLHISKKKKRIESALAANKKIEKWKHSAMLKSFVLELWKLYVQLKSAGKASCSDYRTEVNSWVGKSCAVVNEKKKSELNRKQFSRMLLKQRCGLTCWHRR